MFLTKPTIYELMTQNPKGLCGGPPARESPLFSAPPTNVVQEWKRFMSFHTSQRKELLDAAKKLTENTLMLPVPLLALLGQRGEIVNCTKGSRWGSAGVFLLGKTDRNCLYD